MKHTRAILILLGLAVYAVLFYATELPSLKDEGGVALRRGELLFVLVFQCDEMLLAPSFGSPPEFSLADRLPILLLDAAILGYAFSLGWLLMRLCGTGRRLTRLETTVFAVAVGLNAVGTYVLLVGLLGLLGNRLVFALPAMLTLTAAGWTAWRSRKGKGRRVKDRRVPPTPNPQPPTPNPRPLSPHWLWCGLPFVLVIVLGGMLPPVDFDVREYHLQVPKEFFQQGRITFMPHNVYGNMALGTEMLSLLAMEISSDWWFGALVGKTLIAAMAPLAALALLAAGRRFFSPAAGIFAALFYISIPWIASVSTAGLVEGASAYYLFTAVYAVLLWQERAGQPSAGADGKRIPDAIFFVLLAGYLAGGAVSVKYPAVLFVVLPLAAWVFWFSRSEQRLWLKSLGIFLLAVVLGCGLWFGKNWVLAGNPTYPLLYEVFDGESWSIEKNEQWNHVHRPHDFSLSTLASDSCRVALRSEWLSPLLMPLALLALLQRRRRRLACVLLAFFAYAIVVWWLFTHRIDRFWIPMLSVLALLAGAGACWSARPWWRRAALAILLFTLAANFPVATAVVYNRYFVALDRLRLDRERVDPWHRYFNRHAAAGRVLMVGDAQMFDLEVPVLYNTCFDDCLFEQMVKGRTVEQIRKEFAARSVAYVYVHWGEIARYRDTKYGFTDFVCPEVFDRLVDQGILRPLPNIKGHPGRGYRVMGLQD